MSFFRGLPGTRSFTKSHFQHQLRLQSTKPLSATRPVSFQAQSHEEAHKQLALQRRQRPVSPDLGIYKWQVHSVSSAMLRNTGLMFSIPLYIFGLSYLAGPYLGWDLSAASLAASFASWPVFAQFSAKFALAWPFTFHCINGIANLVASTGWTMANKARFIRVGWFVVGASLASAIGMVAYL